MAVWETYAYDQVCQDLANLAYRYPEQIWNNQSALASKFSEAAYNAFRLQGQAKVDAFRACVTYTYARTPGLVLNKQQELDAFLSALASSAVQAAKKEQLSVLTRTQAVKRITSSVPVIGVPGKQPAGTGGKTNYDLATLVRSAGVPRVAQVPPGIAPTPMPLVTTDNITDAEAQLPSNPVRIEKSFGGYTYYVADDASRTAVLGLLRTSKPIASMAIEVAGKSVEAIPFSVNPLLEGPTTMDAVYNQAVQDGHGVVVCIIPGSSAEPYLVVTDDIAVASALTVGNASSVVLVEPANGWPLPTVQSPAPEQPSGTSKVVLGVAVVAGLAVVGGLAYYAMHKPARATANRRRRRH